MEGGCAVQHRRLWGSSVWILKVVLLHTHQPYAQWEAVYHTMLASVRRWHAAVLCEWTQHGHEVQHTALSCIARQCAGAGI